MVYQTVTALYQLWLASKRRFLIHPSPAAIYLHSPPQSAMFGDGSYGWATMQHSHGPACFPQCCPYGMESLPMFLRCLNSPLPSRNASNLIISHWISNILILTALHLALRICLFVWICTRYEFAQYNNNYYDHFCILRYLIKRKYICNKYVHPNATI